MNRLACERMLQKLTNLFADFQRVALMNADHDIIFLKAQKLSDVGTLSQCAEVSNSYLHLQDGDIVLTNDPFSGGSLLSSPTLIVGLGNRTVKGNVPAEFLISHRFDLPLKVGPFKNLEAEGLRIPPSPYYIRGELNKPIVAALKSHPMLSEKITDLITNEAKKLLNLKNKLSENLASQNLDLSRQTVKAYIQATSREFNTRIESLAEGTKNIEMPLSEKESIRLRLDHHEGHFNFDFSGTSPGEEIFLTDSVTIGTVVGATVGLLNLPIPINSGIFSLFDIKAPRGSFLNATYPRSVFLGHTDGTHLLANAVARCLSQISKNYASATTGPSICQYQIAFDGNRIFVDQLQTGTGANAKGPGQNAISTWSLARNDFSVEQMEKEFPISFQSSGYRTESSGAGKFSGGLGMVRRLKVLENAELSWTFAIPPHNPEGIEGGKTALNTEILVTHTDGKVTELPSSGTFGLKKGDVVSVLSSGGGGFGVLSD